MAKNKPPKETQFKPGQSGNPAGKPKGTLSMSTKIKKWLSTEIDEINPFTGEKEKMDVADVLIQKQVLKAKKGDTRAFEVLKDHIEAKPKQEIDLNQEITWKEEKSYVKPKSE